MLLLLLLELHQLLSVLLLHELDVLLRELLVLRTALAWWPLHWHERVSLVHISLMAVIVGRKHRVLLLVVLEVRWHVLNVFVLDIVIMPRHDVS